MPKPIVSVLPVLLSVAALGACERGPGDPLGVPDVFVCVLQHEVCDGRDNDCDGIVDNPDAPEYCDGLDNDCDRSIDEGADCDGFDAPPWSIGPGSSGVIVLDDGSLTLAPPAVTLPQPALWIANTDEGTVSRLDPMTGRETARYPSVDRGGLTFGHDNQPSRTALDQQLDAYVANRAFNTIASVTKIAGTPERCVDRDADGVIVTSTDLDGDGEISLDPMLGEFIGTEDECVLWTVAVGGDNAVARALAIGLPRADGQPGDVWVGLYTEQVALVLAADRGTQLASIPLGLSPYGAVTGADGRVWFTSGPGGAEFIVAVDPETYATERVALPTGIATYGISVDGVGRIILAGEWERRWRGVAAYDPVTERWLQSPPLSASPNRYAVRGIAASSRAIWLAGRSPTEDGMIWELAIEDLALVAAHPIRGAVDLVGVGVAFDGGIWGIAKGSDRAYRLDRETDLVRSFPVGHTPYTYSDFTGFGLNGLLGEGGEQRVVLEGCRSTVWTSLVLDADIPEETRVRLRVRVGDTTDELAAAPWYGPFEPPEPSLALPPGPVPASHLIEISLELGSTTPGIVPRVFGLRAIGRCDGVS